MRYKIKYIKLKNGIIWTGTLSEYTKYKFDWDLTQTEYIDIGWSSV